MSIGGVGGVGGAQSPYAARPSGGPSGAGPGGLPSANDAVSEFLSWAKMTPAQRMRANILASMGLKESDIAAMSAKDRADVEKKIADKIKQLVQQDTEKKTGAAVDLKV
jgi:hypothetical protein